MSAAGARAAAEDAVGTLGAATVVVRLPVAPVAASDAEELGLPAPEFHDVTLFPCVVRTRRDGSRELLTGAQTLELALAVADEPAVHASLSGAAFVQVEGVAWLLHTVQACSVEGRPYLYRLLLRAAAAEVRA